MARTSSSVKIEAGDIQIWAVEIKDGASDTRVTVATDDSAMVETPNIIPVGWEYRASDTTYTSGDATVLQTDVNGKLKVSWLASWGSSSSGSTSTIMIWSEKGTYTFDASEKTVTIAGTKTFNIEEILTIINITDQIVIYSPSDTGAGGTISGNVITLEYDTTAMDDADSLQIFVQYNNSQDYDLWGQKTLPQNNVPKIVTSPETLVSATPYELTASFADVGAEFYVWASESITLWVTLDIGTSVNPEIRILFKHTTAGTEEYREIYLWSPTTNITTINLNDYQIASDADQLFKINIPTNGALYMQVQAKDDVNGDGQIDALYITKVPR